MTNFQNIKSKIYSLTDLVERLKTWRKSGEKIVFTNGCFDLVHRGHVEMLANTADLGDRLVIGLNTDISIRTTLIVGHPGEEEKHFQEMCDFVSRNRFDRLGVFTYSHEEGTHSHSFEDNVPETVKRKRYNSIMSLQQKISHEINQEKVGKTFKVLIDRGDKNNYFGRTEFDSPEVDNEVIIPVKNSHLRIGEFYDAKIVGARAYDLVGKIV